MKVTNGLTYVRQRRQRTTPTAPKLTTATGAASSRAIGLMIAPSGSAALPFAAGEFGNALVVIRIYFGGHCPRWRPESPRVSSLVGSASSSAVGRCSSAGEMTEPPPGPLEMVRARNVSASGWSNSPLIPTAGCMYPPPYGWPGRAEGGVVPGREGREGGAPILGGRGPWPGGCIIGIAPPVPGGPMWGGGGAIGGGAAPGRGGAAAPAGGGGRAP
mmetsp:Transcript_12437/g.39662  ORF Transcript_12437/g.39662 Transcript_12437/m.39662 type:complete len:216 (+) Transcript_12437:2015-2662(+)